MKKRPNPMTDVRDRIVAGYPQQVAAVKAYMGPTPYGINPMTREAADKVLAQMAPEDVGNLAIQNPVAAEQAAQRLNVLDARASSARAYSDIGLED